MSNNRRIVVLLGAGASRDAGLPLTSELAQQVLERLSGSEEYDGRRPEWLDALNFVYGAMVSYRTRDGGNALDAVNIETLISALRLLAHRDQHEVAPFVDSWRSRAGRFRVDDTNADRLLEALRKALTDDHTGFGGRRRVGVSDARAVAYAVAEVADQVGNPTRLASYGAAAEQVTRTLGVLLRPTKSVSYLNPLAELARRQPSGVDVITLNYDLTVESAMSEQSIGVDRGIRNWPSERVTYSEDSQLRLHKVHGSLDWMMERNLDGLSSLTDLQGEVARQPWVVVGDREKLATVGPTLELVHEASNALERADHLVVAGYGFGDTHVNEMIRYWVQRDRHRTIGIIEPNWAVSTVGSFRDDLTRLWGEKRHTQDGSVIASRIQGFAGGTKEHLSAALAHSAVDASREIFVELVSSEGSDTERSVVLQLGGASLRQVHFSVPSGDCSIQTKPGLGVEVTRSIQFLQEWAVGQRNQLRIKLRPSPWAVETLSVHGHGLVSRVQRTVNLGRDLASDPVDEPGAGTAHA